MLFVILYFKLRNFVISQFGIRKIVLDIFYKIKNAFKHGSCEKNFLDSMRGGGGGVFGLFLTQIYKKCNGGGGGGGVKK
jgi:hypothetical protein